MATQAEKPPSIMARESASVDGYASLGGGVHIRHEVLGRADIKVGAKSGILTFSSRVTVRVHSPDYRSIWVEGPDERHNSWHHLLELAGFILTSSVPLRFLHIVDDSDLEKYTVHVKAELEPRPGGADERESPDPLVAVLELDAQNVTAWIVDGHVLTKSWAVGAPTSEDLREHTDTLTKRLAAQQVAMSELCEDFRKNNDPENDLQLELFIHLLEAILKRLHQIREGVGGPNIDSALIEAAANEGKKVLTIDDALDVGDRALRTGERGLNIIERTKRFASELISYGGGGGPDSPLDTGA